MTDTRVHEPAAPRAGGRPQPAEDRSGADSLFRNAYFLMLSTGVSAVLGLGFWLVAARYYSEEAVGQGSAAIAAMRLLASITATTMIGAVVRFVPRAGRRTARLVWGVYGASSVVVALAAGVFLLTLERWGASYEPLGTPAAGALFVAACVAWALLTLQDGVLTGLRRAAWVPAGNAVFSVGKLVLLAVLASALPVLGIFVSWAVAIAFSTLPLGWLIFRRLIPRQAAADRDAEPPGLRSMGRFLAGDSLGALFSLAMINLLPVMVAVRFGAAENGYFYVAYTVGGTMEFLAINMASSLTAHASHDPRRLADGLRGALRRMTLLLVPAVLVLVVLAPWILTPFSPGYAEHGSTVLRLLALGALPRVVVELYIGVLRVQGRTGVLAVLQGAMCALVLGSATVLFTPAGIAGAGWAVLIGMTLMAAVSAPGLRAALRDTGGVPAGRPAPAPEYGTRWARLNATAGYGPGRPRPPAYDGEGAEKGGEDTVTLFIGHPGYEREALQADTLALIVRPHGPDAARAPADGSAADGPVAADGRAAGPGTDHAPEPDRQGGTVMRPPATPRERSAPEPVPEGTAAPATPDGTAAGRTAGPPAPRASQSSSPAGEPVTDLSALPPVPRGRRGPRAALPAVPLLAALALWGYAVRHTDVSRLDDFGLVTALHPAFWAGLAVLTAGFWHTVRDPRRPGGWAAAYVLGLLVMERATQALLYPTPLYAWAWKHDGVVDHLLTAGGLQTADQVGDMAVYDQWPGFFAAQAALVRLLGVESAAMYMAWWPLVSSLMLLLPLLLVYRTFTEDRRLIWTGVWLFCVANWVGQDYFSPQSVAFALHLGVLAVVLRRFGRSGGTRGRQGQAVWTVVLSVLVVAIVISHQLTPGMLVVSLLALCLVRRHRDRVPVVTTVVVFLAWCLTAALPFLSAALPDMIRSAGDLGGNVATGYGATPTGTGAVTTSWAARLLTATVLLLAVAGVWRQRVLRRRALPLLLLAAAPLPMLVASGYGSEMLFRVLLFMLPGVAFFAAAALVPRVRTPAAGDGPDGRAEGPARGRWRRGAGTGGPLLVLLAATLAFVPSYSGKDRISYFPPAEVALVQRLFDEAPGGSTVVAANRNYPLAYASYGSIGHYWFLEDDRRHVDEVVRDPAATLAADMAGVERPGRAYFLLTRGQFANSEMNGQLTEDQLNRIRDSVAGSPRFRLVAENDAGVVYELRHEDADEPAGEGEGPAGEGEGPAGGAER
ncbi:lipopolysaccharide biosynthesis protein [Streptomyces pilosus]|uniref:Lipopolysaccharide biosynthesis protein n=1 Tax=Streptomyces pilosus TaxID=28893 RepID=A0A918BPZ7_9ACTN|nr:lipopolysaccharide biosynthesis protein [Streptomyces pilosus]GGQ82466.1 hypothetical protein GCM10010280_31640 [Streptomyces pilosus]